MPPDFVAHDTGSILIIVCRDQNGSTINLTNYYVTLRWRYIPNGPMTNLAVMTNLDQTLYPGQCSYRWLAGELVHPSMYYDAVITETATERYVTQLDEVRLNIRKRANDPGSASPSASPSGSPTTSISASPSVTPSASPSLSPSLSPSASPSSSASSSGSASPSASPSSSPSASPSSSTSASPSAS